MDNTHRALFDGLISGFTKMWWLITSDQVMALLYSTTDNTTSNCFNYTIK